MRIILCLIILIFLLVENGVSQKGINEAEVQQEEIIFISSISEEMPLFTGCYDPTRSYRENFKCSGEALLKYIYENLKYPNGNCVEGTVVIECIIDETGKIVDPKVVRSFGVGADEEALKVIWAMGKWTPGKINGKPVPIQMYLPVKFRLY